MAAPVWPPEFTQTAQLGGTCFFPHILGPFLIGPLLHQLPAHLLWDREGQKLSFLTVTGRTRGPTLTGALLRLWMHLEKRSPWHRT